VVSKVRVWAYLILLKFSTFLFPRGRHIYKLKFQRTHLKTAYKGTD
jgi:hypothetical protein